MINMPKNTNNRWPWLEKLLVVFINLDLGFLFDGFRLFTPVLDFKLKPFNGGNASGHFLIDRLVHRGKNAHFHKFGNQLKRFEPDKTGKIANDDGRFDDDEVSLNHATFTRFILGRRCRGSGKPDLPAEEGGGGADAILDGGGGGTDGALEDGAGTLCQA